MVRFKKKRKLNYCYLHGFDLGTSHMHVMQAAKYMRLWFVKVSKWFIKPNWSWMTNWSWMAKVLLAVCVQFAERIWASFAPHPCTNFTANDKRWQLQTVEKDDVSHRWWAFPCMGTKTAPIRVAAGKKSAWTQMECVQCRQTDRRTDGQLFSFIKLPARLITCATL